MNPLINQEELKEPIRPCHVCGRPTPVSQYCENECWSLDSSNWKPGTSEEDVVASILGKVRVPNRMKFVEAVYQIDYVYKQLLSAQHRALLDEVEKIIDGNDSPFCTEEEINEYQQAMGRRSELRKEQRTKLKELREGL